MKNRLTGAQIIGVLKESEAGAKVADLCRKHGISEATYYNWKAKFCGMSASDAQRLKELGQENNKLKTLLAESMLDKAALQTFLAESSKPAGQTRSGQDVDDRARHGYHPGLRAGRHLPVAVRIRK